MKLRQELGKKPRQEGGNKHDTVLNSTGRNQ